MVEDGETGGRFASAKLRPEVTVARGSNLGLALRLHEDAHAQCFIANSVNFPVSCVPTIREEGSEQ